MPAQQFTAAESSLPGADKFARERWNSLTSVLRGPPWLPIQHVEEGNP
jgi:hypothetical protein